MRAFDYFDPHTAEEACSLLAQYKEEAKIIAGGQSLLILLKQRLFSPQCLVNVKSISDLIISEINSRSCPRQSAWWLRTDQEYGDCGR